MFHVRTKSLKVTTTADNKLQLLLTTSLQPMPIHCCFVIKKASFIYLFTERADFLAKWIHHKVEAAEVLYRRLGVSSNCFKAHK
jgi:hypothetical protein